jgi:S1-C subfamily serine protease
MADQNYSDPDSSVQAKVSLHTEGDADLALLQITGTGFHPLALLDASAVVPDNSKLVLCSYPFGVSQAQTEPRLLTVTGGPRGSIMAMDHTVDPGESGAPLLNADGKVVGLAASANQCIPIPPARKLIP